MPTLGCAVLEDISIRVTQEKRKAIDFCTVYNYVAADLLRLTSTSLASLQSGHAAQPRKYLE